MAPASPDPEVSHVPQPQPADIGFGYIEEKNRESVVVPMTPKTPLKSALKVPGSTAKQFANPLSPTFQEEELLEKREQGTEKEQARDIKVKTRVRMAKFALRGVGFSCSLIILAMLSSSFAIFNATKALPNQSSMSAWPPNTASTAWPQKLSLSMACLSLFISVLVFFAYCRGGHKRAEKVSTYHTMFAIGWFLISMTLWIITAAVFQHARDTGNNKDMWGWACVDNTRSDVFSQKVDYQLVCRLQNWTLICIIIEVVIEVISIALYSVVFYRYYTKRRLFKSMNLRDRARSDLYLAQLRSQSVPNSPAVKSPTFSQYAMSPRFPPAAYRNLSDIEKANPFTPGGHIPEPQSHFSRPQPAFKLQSPPSKARPATPRLSPESTPSTHARPPPMTTPGAAVEASTWQAAHEPTYEAVPVPGAYAGSGSSHPSHAQTIFGQAR